MDREEYKKRLKCKFHVLLSKTGNIHNKEAMLSGCGVVSSSDLTIEQLTALINGLEDKRETAGTQTHYKQPAASDRLLKDKRSSVLKLITGSPTAHNPKERGLGVPNDWALINPFIKNHAGAYLYELNIERLEQLRRKLFSMRETHWYYGKKEQYAAPSAASSQHQAQKPTQIAMVLSPTFGADDMPN